MVTRLRRVNPVQFALVYGVIAAFIALIIAVLMLPFGALMASMPSGRMFGAGMGIMMVIILPLMYFVFAFIGGLITAAVYNLVAGWTGGIEITLDSAAPVVAAPSAGGYTA